jgi:4-alpha-glucanotransferase
MSGRATQALLRRAEAAGLASEYEPAGGGAPRAICREALATVLERLEQQGPADAGRARRISAAHRSAAPCVSVAEATGRDRVWGLWTHLYSLRSDRGFGIGHLGDLRQLVRWAGERGADFVGLNPLHGLPGGGHEVSPYSPVTRLFRDPMHLDLTATPEWSDCPEARRLFESGESGRERRRLVESDRIDHARAEALRARIALPLWQQFQRAHRAGDDERGRAFTRFVHDGGQTLLDYATYRALEQRMLGEGRSRDWRSWPATYHDPRGETVRRFRAQESDPIERALWELFELDRQLAEVDREARRAGLSLGLYQDLALGSDAGGFDCWAFPEGFVDGVSLGAPPDDYARDGQNWGLPPLHPWNLGQDDFAFFRRVLRAGLAHAGMLRIDHVLGLLRQWWIPDERPSTEGVYVRFPASALLSVVAEESRRAGAVIVGEDLGTVPRGFTSLLARHGVLSCRVLLFERDRRGGFRRASEWSKRALATAHTHDHPPMAGWWSARDLERRAELGELDAVALARAREEREAERWALVSRLLRAGALACEEDAQDPELRCAAIHRFLCRTPSPLVGLSLDDLAGEEEPVNIPGVPLSRFPAWQRRMGRSLDDLLGDPELDRRLGEAPVLRPRR